MGIYHVNGNDTPLQSCKALRSGDTVYVAAGDVPRGLKKNVLAIADWFEVNITTLNASPLVSSLKDLVTKNRLVDPSRSKYQPGFDMLTIYTARFNGKTMSLRLTRFSVTQSGSITALRQDFSGSGTLCHCPNNHDAPNRNRWVNIDPVKVVRDGLEALFSYADSFSGPPATIVNIAPTGIDWVALGNCKADGSNAWEDPR